MASKRTAQFLDAQNFIYELNQKYLQINDDLNRHMAENGKDSKYYMFLGWQHGIGESKRMAEEFANGKYRVEY